MADTYIHQLNTDILDENGTCISNAVSLSSRKCLINIVSVLLNIIFKHNFKKLLNSLHFFCSMSGVQNYCKVVKRMGKLFEPFWALW